MIASTLTTDPTHVSVQQIHQVIDALPPESLGEVASFLEFLQFKSSQRQRKRPAAPRLQIIKLRGILKGHDFSPEMLAEARREMWRKFYTDSAPAQ